MCQQNHNPKIAIATFLSPINHFGAFNGDWG
jgi:hypothetical protein